MENMQAMLDRAREKLKPLSLAILCTTQLLDAVGLSGVNIAIPTLAIDFGLDGANLSWIVSAYALTYGALMLVTGRLGDVYGHRNLFLIGVLIFSIFSLICGVAQSSILFIICRAFQGVGAAATVPNGLALITLSYQGRDRERAIGFFGAAGAVGGTVGLVLGGVFTSTIGWRWIFYMCAIIGGVQALLGFLIIHQPPLPELRSKKIDYLGAGVFTSAVLLLVFVFTESSIRGWGDPLIYSLLIVSVCFLLAFVLIEYYVSDPIMPLSVWTSVNFTPAIVIALCVLGNVTALGYWVTQLWQLVRLQSALNTALQFLVASVTVVLSMPFVILITAKFGVRPLLIIGSIFIFAIPLGFCFTDGTVNFWTLPFLTWLFGYFGVACVFYGVTLAAVNSAPKKLQGVIGGLVNTAVQVGGGVTLAITTAVASSTSNINPLTATTDELIKGYHNASWTIVGLFGVGFLMALFFIQNVPAVSEPDEVAEAQNPNEKIEDDTVGKEKQSQSMTTSQLELV